LGRDEKEQPQHQEAEKKSSDQSDNGLQVLHVRTSGARPPGPPPGMARSAQVPVPNTTTDRLERAMARSAAAPC
jgi:hypothetical protein